MVSEYKISIQKTVLFPYKTIFIFNVKKYTVNCISFNNEISGKESKKKSFKIL